MEFGNDRRRRDRFFRRDTSVCCSKDSSTSSGDARESPQSRAAAASASRAATERSTSGELSTQQLEIGIFWDYENVRVPRTSSAVDVAQARLRKVAGDSAERLGFPNHRIVERRLYFDSRKPSEAQVDRSSLDFAFTIVDCPTRNQKETLDKKIIVDVMHYAYERHSRGCSTCVVLISSDGDFAYMLSRLRDLGVKVVVIYGSNVASGYLESADLSFHWRDEVLQPEDSAEEPPPCSTGSSSWDDAPVPWQAAPPFPGPFTTAAAFSTATASLSPSPSSPLSAASPLSSPPLMRSPSASASSSPPPSSSSSSSSAPFAPPLSPLDLFAFLQALVAHMREQPGQRVDLKKLAPFYAACPPEAQAPRCKGIIRNMGGFKAFCSPGGAGAGLLRYTPDQGDGSGAWISLHPAVTTPTPTADLPAVAPPTPAALDAALDAQGFSSPTTAERAHTSTNDNDGGGGGVGGEVEGCHGSRVERLLLRQPPPPLLQEGRSGRSEGKATTTTTTSSRQVSQSSNFDLEGRHHLLLLCLRTLQLRALAPLPQHAVVEEQWVSDASLANEFYRRKCVTKSADVHTKAKAKELYQNLRSSACDQGFVEAAHWVKDLSPEALARLNERQQQAGTSGARCKSGGSSGLNCSEGVRPFRGGFMVPAAEWASVSGSLDRESWPTHMWFRLTQTGARAEEDDVEEGGVPGSSSLGEAGKGGVAAAAVGLAGSSVGEEDLVGPPGATLRCNRGDDCYFLKKGVCSFLHRAAEARAAADLQVAT